MHCRSSAAHCPRALRHCIAEVALPTAPRQRGSALQELHCPKAAWQCVTLPAAPCPQQQCIRAHTMPCRAEHQAVWHRTEGTGGAARHAGCSGEMRPCVTARRRRQGSVGQVQECTGPAMPPNTYTRRAHNTHSRARLPLPVGRHPRLLPFGNSAFGTTQRGTAQNGAACHATARHTTAEHSAARHNRAERTTTQHRPPRYSTAKHSTTQHGAPKHTTAPKQGPLIGGLTRSNRLTPRKVRNRTHNGGTTPHQPATHGLEATARPSVNPPARRQRPARTNHHRNVTVAAPQRRGDADNPTLA